MTSTNTFGIVFFLKKDKAKNGKAPIYARITVDGKRVDVALKTSATIETWSDSKGMAKPKSDDLKSLNSFLEQIRSQLVECYQQLQLKKKLITAEAVKVLYCQGEEKEFSLMNVIDYHNAEMKNSLEWGTQKNYITTRRYVGEYLKTKLHTSDIYLAQLNYKFITDFEKFLKEIQPKGKLKPCRQNGAMKHIERLRKIVNMAVKNDWLEKDPFQKFSAHFTKSTREYLNADELNAIEQTEIKIARLEQVKDLFVFSCYTGLAYVDVMRLTAQNISKGIDGEYWLYTSRKKTDESVRVPLLPKAMEILDKYKKHPEVIHSGGILPKLSNQKLNNYLKEIAALSGIKKNLTFHLARHTFATTITLTNGVPIETVSKLLGHSSIKTTQIYAKVVERKLSDDMNILKTKLNQQAKPSIVQSS